MLSSKAQHDTEAARGPMESRLKDSGKAPVCETRLAVGLKPVSPQKADGIRTDPPVSVPMAATAIWSATDTPAPEEEQLGRAHVCTPLPKGRLVCRLLLDKNQHT